MAPLALRCCAAAAVAVLLAVSARAQTDHDDQVHHFVRIIDDRLQPRVVEMRARDAIAWGNYTRKKARILFDREVARHIVCERPGSFALTDRGLESAQLRGLQFASLCKLGPGEYEYRVELEGVTAGHVPARALKGWIVVTD